MSEKARPDPSPQPSLKPYVSDYGEGRTSSSGLDEGDMSLIDVMLKMTPTGRLRALEGFVQDVQIFRRARKL